MLIKNWRPLHLFLYHKNDDATRSNYEQLALTEGSENIQPISDCQSYLPNTFRADLQKWTFPHWDSYWMCDGLVYKYLLYNKDRVLNSSYVCINEYDTWWQYPSKEWMPKSMESHDIIGSNFLSFGKNKWEFFEKHKHLHFANELRGLVPFSVICIKPETSIAIAERVQSDCDFHNLYNNEMRIATAANIIKSKIGLLPLSISKNVQWHGCSFTNEKSIYHPIKNTIKKSLNINKYVKEPSAIVLQQAFKKSRSIKFLNKIRPFETIVVNFDNKGKARIGNQEEMKLINLGKNKMAIFNTKNKLKVGEIIENNYTKEYLLFLDINGKTSATAWIGKEI